MADTDNEEEAPGRGYDSQLVRWLLRYLSPHRWHILTVMALTTATAPLVLAGPPLTKAAVDLFLAPDPSKPPEGFELLLKRCSESIGLGGSAQKGLLFIAIVFLLASAASLTIRYAQTIVTGMMGQNLMYDLRRDIFGRTQQLPIEFCDRTPVGRLMTRLTSDVESLNEMFTSGAVSLLGNIAMVVYMVIWMFRVNWRLALVSFTILPLLAGLSLFVGLAARSVFGDLRMRMAGINAFLQERFVGMHIVQLFTRDAREIETFSLINGAHRKANIDTVFLQAIFNPLVGIAEAVGVALIIWYGGRQVLSKVEGVSEFVTLGTLVAFIQIALAFYEPISEISDKYNVFQRALASSERIFKLMNEPLTVTSPDKPVQLDKARGRIEFRNVWFAYKDDDWVLKDVSFVVEPGEKIAVVGHTGAGKTTITNLLLRFYDIQRGQILFDDVDIREVDLADLRSNFGIVLQDIFLFSGDIASNIRLGNQSITDDRVKSAAREVRADTFIANLPKGYQTELRERGAGLSVGQKQLIGFARALAFDRPVLILDEATSSIDSETETLIHNAIEQLMAGRTALVIAHRLSTIQSVDKIVVIHKGEVREVGDHQSLLAQRGLYWRLYELQFVNSSSKSESSADEVNPVRKDSAGNDAFSVRT